MALGSPDPWDWATAGVGITGNLMLRHTWTRVMMMITWFAIAGIIDVAKRRRRKLIKTETDLGAFKKRFQMPPPPCLMDHYQLRGFIFAVCDSFDIEGHSTGFGNPYWERTHDPATQTSAVVAALLKAGAILIGKTVMSDMALSITGENKHYGTPTNPLAPERIPGGVSSGASVAVAAKLADFSLGIDTDGGVRVAAGYCGACGFRPSHGIISLSGVIPVSRSLDTVGWFARNTNVLKEVGHVVLPAAKRISTRTFLIAEDCFTLAKFPAECMKSIERVFEWRTFRRVDLGDYLRRNVPSLKLLHLMESGVDGLSSQITVLANAMQKLKRHELKQNHNEWIDSVKPTLDPADSRQVSEIRGLAASEVENCHTIRRELLLALCSLLKDDGILVMPTCINPPSKIGAGEILSEDYLVRTSAISSLASMSGCCEATLPIGVYKNYPVSVSLLAKHGGDRFLLGAVDSVHHTLLKNVQGVTKSPMDNIFSRAGRSASSANLRGISELKMKKWQKAVESFTQAIEHNGSNVTYYNNRAAAYYAKQSYPQAEADCTKAIELDEKNVYAHTLRRIARRASHWLRNYDGDVERELVEGVLYLDPTNYNREVSESMRRLKSYGMERIAKKIKSSTWERLG